MYLEEGHFYFKIFEALLFTVGTHLKGGAPENPGNVMITSQKQAVHSLEVRAGPHMENYHQSLSLHDGPIGCIHPLRLKSGKKDSVEAKTETSHLNLQQTYNISRILRTLLPESNLVLTLQYVLGHEEEYPLELVHKLQCELQILGYFRATKQKSCLNVSERPTRQGANISGREKMGRIKFSKSV